MSALRNGADAIGELRITTALSGEETEIPDHVK